jgi:hypothetical protein
MTHTIRWEGRIAIVGEPTVDGRTIYDGLLAQIRTPVYWLNPSRLSHDQRENLGTLDWVWGAGGGGLYGNGPVFGRLSLNLDVLPRPYETLWPEIDLAPSPHEASWTYRTITAICLGTQPAWDNLDPVIVVKGR